MIIQIHGTDYNFDVKSWWGPLYKFEDIMNVAEHPERKFNPFLTFHMHVMFYAVLLCDNDTIDLTLDDFLDALGDIELAGSLSDFYNRRIEILMPAREKIESETSKKKS